MRARLVLALSAAAVAAAPLAAQYRNTPTLSIEASGVYTGVPTRVFPGLEDGRGGEAQVTLGIGNFAISGGISRTWHDVTPGASLPGVFGADGAQITTLFVEPRLALPLGVSNFTPFVYGRAGRTHQDYTRNGDDFGGTGDGLTLGAGGGVLVEIFKGASLNFGGGYQWFRAGNTFADGTRPTGGGYMVRAGLLIGGTRWARDPGF